MMVQDIKTPVNDYAPGAKALGHISKLTSNAVKEIGTRPANEIREAACSLEEEAKVIADQMRDFAAALDEQGEYFADRVSKFGEKAAEVSKTITELRAKIEEGSFVKADLADDGAPIPHFFQTPLPQSQLREAAE
jgi:hypothetical protein